MTQAEDLAPHERAEELRLAGDLSRARSLVQERLAGSTGDDRGRLLAVLGRVNLDSAENAAAAITLEEAVKLCQGVAPAEGGELLLDLGLARQRIGQLDGALEVLQRAGDRFIEADQPAGQRLTWAAQGRVHYDRQAWDKAAEAFAAALGLAGDAPPTWQLEHALARTCERRGQPDAALRHYERARTVGWDGFSGDVQAPQAGPAAGFTVSAGDTLVDHDLGQELTAALGELAQGDLLLLVALAGELNAALDPAAVLETLLARGLAWTPAERGQVVVCRARRGGGAPKLEGRLARERDGAETAAPGDEVSRAVTRWVAQHGEPLFAGDVAQDPRLEELGTARAGERSVACVPLAVRRGPALGALYLEVRDELHAFAPRHQALIGGLARLVALAYERSGRFARLTDAYNATRLAYEEQLGQAFDLIGRGPAMCELFRQVERLRDHETPVLVEGEPGTGKELIARAIHRHSRRRGGPFVVEACGSLPDGLIEAELFGHARGGVGDARRGAFERAAGGTLFLDDVSAMSARMQGLLMRVLETGEIRPPGSPAPQHVDCRLICASGQPLEEAVRRGAFREDLYLRLSVIQLEVPPLRERPDDLPALVEAFLADKGRSAADLTPKALEAILAHDWPGNLRELRHALDRAGTLAGGGQIQPRHLGIDALRASSGARRLGRSSSGSQSAGKVDWHGYLLNQRQVALLDFLRARGVATNREYVQLVNVSVPTGWRDLKDLLDKSLIRAEGQGRNTVYRLSESAPIKHEGSA